MSIKHRRFTSQFKAKVAMEAMKDRRTTIGELVGLHLGYHRHLQPTTTQRL
ncbi:MAG: hypothetical protein M1472_05640 [Planctomycetes bacterium]|nr:hypothetical protein [Planctomycetota bacterium]